MDRPVRQTDGAGGSRDGVDDRRLIPRSRPLTA